MAASLAGCSDAGGGAGPTEGDSVGQTEQAETFIGLSLVPYVQPNDRTYDLTDLTLNPAMKSPLQDTSTRDWPVLLRAMMRV